MGSWWPLKSGVRLGLIKRPKLIATIKLWLKFSPQVEQEMRYKRPVPEMFGYLHLCITFKLLYHILQGLKVLLQTSYPDGKTLLIIMKN